VLASIEGSVSRLKRLGVWFLQRKIQSRTPPHPSATRQTAQRSHQSRTTHLELRLWVKLGSEPVATPPSGTATIDVSLARSSAVLALPMMTSTPST
jgi:hypothetical protein